MNLSVSEHDGIFEMAKRLSEIDASDEQSTWIHDPCMWVPRNNNHYYLIESKSNILGFVILRRMNFGKIGIWLSLAPEYRNGNHGSMAAYLALSIAFDKLGAKQVVSDVYRSNKRSNHIHGAIFDIQDDKREDMITYVMTRSRFEENCKRFKR